MVSINTGTGTCNRPRRWVKYKGYDTSTGSEYYEETWWLVVDDTSTPTNFTSNFPQPERKIKEEKKLPTIKDQLNNKIIKKNQHLRAPKQFRHSVFKL